MDASEIMEHVRRTVAEAGELPLAGIAPATPLIGPRAVVKSRALVEILLALEEFAEEHLGVTFDWTSDSAMSQSRSIFRTVESLATHLHGLKG
ncbi:MAG: acyl carrier protein [Alphaproteobacteria bacterium]|nr:acyl carrier protein [Alphaproteobacteria bacterium]